MVNLKNRSVEREVMDDLELPSSAIDPVLKGLGQMNTLFGSHNTIIKALQSFPVNDNDVVSDWGCGGGDTLIAIHKWAQKHNINLKLQGIDAAPAAIKFAKQQSAGYRNISFTKADVLKYDFQEHSCDFVICGLFTHHFNDDNWIVLLKNMNTTARRGVIVTDLHRHWVLYYAVIVITHLFTRNKMVRVDGPLSVKKSFKRKELEILLEKTGIKNYYLKWIWPFRWQIIIYKS